MVTKLSATILRWTRPGASSAAMARIITTCTTVVYPTSLIFTGSAARATSYSLAVFWSRSIPMSASRFGEVDGDPPHRSAGFRGVLPRAFAVSPGRYDRVPDKCLTPH
ncbi:hypothetical protein DMC64_20435 [Amycolatopsis sp. WAC 04197]|nr:hypothetical protein DMC64_20435 [Amycolatopsis sp. WAC 04197]